MIVGISGRAGAGKDAAAEFLVQRGFVRVAFADKMKQICADVFGWDHERLWGPSEKRNEPDPEWDGLTARRALQELGTGWGRSMHPDVWVRATLRGIANWRRTAPPGWNAMGDEDRWVIPDVRHRNEAEAIRKEGGLLVRIVRPGAELAGAPGEHSSETALADDDPIFDATIINGGSLEYLKLRILGAVGLLPVLRRE